VAPPERRPVAPARQAGRALPRRPPARGFTLVEVLVALVVMAILAALAWRGVDAIARSRDANSASMESALRVNTVLAQWAHDLQAVHNTTTVPPLAFDGASLRLVRDAEGGVQVVVWSLRGNVWTRWSGPVVTRVGELQDSWMRSQQLLGNEPNQLRALEGVGSVQVYFFRRDGWSNAQSSGDLAQAPPPAAPPASGPGPGGVAGNAAQAEELPSGVRLVLGFDGSGAAGLSGTLTRDVALGPQPL
jgi:general secretion pathway protein J